MRQFMLWLFLATTVASLGAQTPFKTPYSLGDMRGKQAVVETSLGTFVLQLLPDAAPNHVGLFMKIASEGGFAGTAFHRVVKYGVIQGGDPFTRDPARVGGLGTGRLEPGAPRAQRRETHRWRRLGCGRSVTARQRRLTVFRRRHRSAGPRWSVHGVRAGRGRD